MNLYKVKLKESNISKFILFCETYHIKIIMSYSKEEFWDNVIYAFITDTGTQGITTEEKQRLINESGFNISNTQTITA